MGKKARETLEREGNAICRKITGEFEKKGAKLLDRLSMKDRVVISATAFWCMVEMVVFLLAAFICTCMATAWFIHSARRWKMLGCTAGFLVLCIVLTVFTCRKLKQ